MTKLHAGQVLIFVPSRYRTGGKEPYEVTVLKVGRKWATLGPHGDMRIDTETLVADGGGNISPRPLLPDPRGIRGRIPQRPRDGRFQPQVGSHRGPIDADKIMAAAEILGIDMGDVE